MSAIGGGGFILPAGFSRILGSLRGANFNVTTDQAIAILPSVTKFAVTGIFITNASLSLTLAVGGFYPSAAKAGVPLVAATQLYSALTSATVLLPATLAAAALATAYAQSQLFFSLTTAQGAAATADIYVAGLDLT
jgi:hypothetical protein